MASMEEPSHALLLLNLPPAALAGIDLLSFTTSPRFHGIKALPSGLHFFFTAPHSTMAVRHGAWFAVGTGAGLGFAPQLVIKKWDTASETLRPEMDVAETMRQRANLGQIWKTGMTPYRQRADTANADGRDAKVASGAGFIDEENDLTGWKALSKHITSDYLRQVLGKDEQAWHLTSYSDTELDTASIPSLRKTGEEAAIESEKPLRLMRVDLKRTWRQGAMGRERTEAARDWSWYLFDLARRHGSDGSTTGLNEPTELRAVLAELQFCYLMALTLNNYACLEHWRTLLRLVLTCRSAVTISPGFFVRFLDTLQAQVSRLGKDDATPLESTQGNEGSKAIEATDTAGDGSQRTNGAINGSAKDMEDQTEDELLRYDLPLRNRDAAAKGKRGALAAEAKAMAKEAEGEREAARQAFAGAELKQLFLEDDGDAGGTSFLQGLLVKFRSGLQDITRGAVDMETEDTTNGETVHDVLKALGRLEATLFDLYGWDFDTVASPSMRRSDLKKTAPTLASEDVDLEGYGITLSRPQRGATRPAAFDDDDDNDEDEEYAPVLVELSQAEMDALGIQGTPSKPVVIEEEDQAPAKELGSGRGRGISGVVVDEDSDSDDEIEEAADSDEEDLDDTNLEDMDTRY